MKLIPDEELRSTSGINLAPMVDFLFLIMTAFAVIAFTRTTMYETDIALSQAANKEEDRKLATLDGPDTAHLAISDKGEYKWLTGSKSVLLQNLQLVKDEIRREQATGQLPDDAEKIKVLLHIDKQAPWDPVVQAIFAIRELGAEVHPVYESTDQ